MINAIIDKFMQEIDREMSSDENYKKISMELDKLFKKEASEETAQIELLVGRLESAVEHASAAAGIKLGAKISAALLK